MGRKIFVAVFCCLMMAISPASKSVAAEYTTDGTADCTVSATVNNSYVVSIPATLMLAKKTDGNNIGKYVGEYTVGAKGNIGSAYSVFITPSSTFVLTSPGKADVAASVSQSKTVWRSSELSNMFSETKGTVVATLTEAGAWSGSLHFSFGITTE